MQSLLRSVTHCSQACSAIPNNPAMTPAMTAGMTEPCGSWKDVFLIPLCVHICIIHASGRLTLSLSLSVFRRNRSGPLK